MAWKILGFSGVEKAANIYDGHVQALNHWWRAMFSVQSSLLHPAYTGGGDRTRKEGTTDSIEVPREGDGRVKLSGGAKGELSCTVVSIMPKVISIDRFRGPLMA